jgi:hypothetical protein
MILSTWTGYNALLRQTSPVGVSLTIKFSVETEKTLPRWKLWRLHWHTPPRSLS